MLVSAEHTSPFQPFSINGSHNLSREMLVDSHVGSPHGVSFACGDKEIKASKLEGNVPHPLVQSLHFPGEENGLRRVDVFPQIMGLAYSEDLDQTVWCNYQLSIIFDIGLVT